MKIEIVKEKFMKIRKEQWFLFLLVGILLAVAAMPVEKEKGDVQGAVSEDIVTSVQEGTVADMEKRLENILCQMAGAGSVRVMITQKSSGEKIVEKDIPSSDRDTQEQDENGTRSTVERNREEVTVYEKDESGSQIPYVTQEIAPQIEGVLVLAQGGDNAVVIKNITDAVMALFNLEAHKIKVMKMN